MPYVGEEEQSSYTRLCTGVDLQLRCNVSLECMHGTLDVVTAGECSWSLKEEVA